LGLEIFEKRRIIPGQIMFKLTLLANPARLKREFLQITEVGPQAMPEELAAEFALMKEESPDLNIGGTFWWDFVSSYKKHIGWLFLGKAVMTLLILIAILASQRILAEEISLASALGLLAVYAVALFLRSVVNAWGALLQSQLLVCVRTFVTLRMNVKLLRMGQLSSDDFSTGNLKTLVSSDIYRLADFLQSIVRNAVPCLFGLLILGPVIVHNMGLPGVIAMLVGFGAMPLAFYLGRYVHKKEGQIKAEEDTLSTIIGEWVSNVRLLRFLGWENLMRTRVAKHVRQLVIEATRQHAVSLINFGISVSWWFFPIIALIGSNRLWGENNDLITLFASIWMLNHITLYIRWLPNIFIDYASAAACVSRIEKLFEHSDITDELLPDHPVSVASARPLKVHFEDVCFRYGSTDTPLVLDSISLSLSLREHVSLIGKVGSGKSTLLKLLCAEIKPSSGRITVEFDTGVTADLWHENIYRQFRSGLGYMPQEAYLSNTSLGVNIALATGQDDADIMQAVRLAELEADMSHWVSGLGEEVGETGVNLSGGQKQRVNLARALYSGRPYLVLDDPLSAVDSTTEASLMKNLRRTPEGFMLCSHRLNELSQTHRLLVLDGGKIIEDGDPKQLMNDPTSEFMQHLNAGDFQIEEPVVEPTDEGDRNES
jgi:ATP-binding cassette subfamily B multidrug efflux pump